MPRRLFDFYPARCYTDRAEECFSAGFRAERTVTIGFIVIFFMVRKQANHMEKTFQPVVLQGVVIHGRGVGGPSGFPTANLELEPGEHLPKERGVYASFADIDGRRFVGVTNIGTRPTVDSSPVVTVETWFPDYQGDLYGRELRLTLTGFLRGIHRFENLGELKAQIDRDSEEARRLLADWETKEK